jgi:hypothetical protein
MVRLLEEIGNCHSVYTSRAVCGSDGTRLCCVSIALFRRRGVNPRSMKLITYFHTVPNVNLREISLQSLMWLCLGER